MIGILINALVPIFAVMGLGYFAGWIRDVDNHHVFELNALVMDFALPDSIIPRYRLSSSDDRSRSAQVYLTN